MKERTSLAIQKSPKDPDFLILNFSFVLINKRRVIFQFPAPAFSAELVSFRPFRPS